MVECHSGYEYADRPTAFVWEGERKEIIDLLASWRTPQGKYFIIKTSDLHVFELCYDQANDNWTIRPI
jgi:hypothetical protein